MFILAHKEARRRACEAIMAAPEGHVVRIEPPKRSTEANARMWVLLTCLANQLDWYGQKLAAEEWKDVMSAALKRQKVVPGVDGGFVVLGQRTSKMTRAEMAELQELVEAFGAEHAVDFDSVAQGHGLCDSET